MSYEKATWRKVFSKYQVYLLAFVVGLIFGVTIINSAKYNGCEHLSGRNYYTGSTDSWVECNE